VPSAAAYDPQQKWGAIHLLEQVSFHQKGLAAYVRMGNAAILLQKKNSRRERIVPAIIAASIVLNSMNAVSPRSGPSARSRSTAWSPGTDNQWCVPDPPSPPPCPSRNT
jgi:hypothetical protein